MALKSKPPRQKPKYKADRRYGTNLWGRPKSPYNRRNTGPGQHGARRGKPSDYGLQLVAKQMLKTHYGNVGEKQFRKYYQEAVRRRGDTGQNLIGLLESRLDAVVYRMKFVPTVWAARQFVNHGHVTVNGKRVNIPSYQVSAGDTIEIREKSRQLPLVLQAVDSAERDIPGYIEVDSSKVKGKYVRAPELSEVPYPFRVDINKVVELYSR